MCLLSTKKCHQMEPTSAWAKMEGPEHGSQASLASPFESISFAQGNNSPRAGGKYGGSKC